jgi:hypothetical protein
MKRGSRILTVSVLMAALLSGCATSAQDGRVAADTVGKGVKYLLLSPVMIVSGVAQGLAFLPYTIGTGLNELNKGLIEADAVPLDDSYKATFGVTIADARVDPESGAIRGVESPYGRYRPEAIQEANRSLQRLLVSQGMTEDKARHYVLTGDYRYAMSRGQVLLAVVYRNPGEQAFRVEAKQTGILTTFRPGQRGWYEPYRQDVGGQSVDEVIDWVALDYKLLRQEKIVATLMVLSVEGIKSGKRSPDYWQVEGPWIAGDTASIVKLSRSKMQNALPSS